MAKDKVDIKNFMGVLAATVETENGIKFPGEFMPSGNPVTAEGVKKAQLMTDKGMAVQWHESIVGAYEREEDERNNVSRKGDSPEIVIGGSPAVPDERPRGEPPTAVNPTSLEEELQARIARWSKTTERLEQQLASLQQEVAAAYKQLTKAEAALDAIRE